MTTSNYRRELLYTLCLFDKSTPGVQQQIDRVRHIAGQKFPFQAKLGFLEWAAPSDQVVCTQSTVSSAQQWRSPRTYKLNLSIRSTLFAYR